MPFERSCEDIALRKRLALKGYVWVMNYNLKSTHIVNDIEVLLHTLHWSKLRKQDLNFFKNLAVISKHFVDSRKEQDFNLSIYLLLLNLAESYGLLVKR
jgi:hypothetical protein